MLLWQWTNVLLRHYFTVHQFIPLDETTSLLLAIGWNLIVRLKWVLGRTVDGNWRFNILSGSHLQSQVKVGNSKECNDTLVHIVIESYVIIWYKSSFAAQLVWRPAQIPQWPVQTLSFFCAKYLALFFNFSFFFFHRRLLLCIRNRVA